jgi:hypothetical protein
MGLSAFLRRNLPSRLKKILAGAVGRTFNFEEKPIALPLAVDREAVHDLQELEQRANQIPSMGGTELGAALRQAARETPPDTAIVEVGTWLGAGTAQLALGLRERSQVGGVSIHCFDRWQATDPEVGKALRMKNLTLRAGEDTLPWVMKTLQPFAVPIFFHKGDFRRAAWSGGQISVYVDDAAKTAPKFLHVLKTFGPHWIPGKTIVVLMDFRFWQQSGADKHECQKRFIERFADHFVLLERFHVDTCDGFLYRKSIDFGSLTLESLL